MHLNPNLSLYAQEKCYVHFSYIRLIVHIFFSGTYLFYRYTFFFINVGPRMAPAVLDAHADRRRQRDAAIGLARASQEYMFG